MRIRIATVGAIAFILLGAFGLGLGCAGLGEQSSIPYAYFGEPDSHDAWSPKIAGWQRRESVDQGDLGDAAATVATGATGAEGENAEAGPHRSRSLETPASGEATAPTQDLRSEYFRFRSDRKRRLAGDVASWIQSQAKKHYVEDGPIDHWATLEETLRGDGDDCDGLELLTFHALRDLGFDPKEVYRAIVYRPADGQHHMVTLWFEDRDDPWVIDPTGAMTSGMPRMSDMPGWVPLKVFSDEVEYTVRQRAQDAAPPHLASNP